MKIAEQYEYIEIEATRAEWKAAADRLPKYRQKIWNALSCMTKGAPDDATKRISWEVKVGAGQRLFALLSGDEVTA